MTTTGHPVVAEEVMALVDGELVGAEARAVAEHIETCAECAELAQEFARMSESFAAWTVEEVPTAVTCTVEEAMPATTGRATGRRAWLLGGGAAATVAVTVAVISVGVLAPRHREQVVEPYLHEATLKEMLSNPRAAAADKVVVAPSAGIMADSNASNSRMSTATDDYMASAPAPPPPPVGLAKVPIAGGGGATKMRAVTMVTPEPMIARTVTLEMTVRSVADARAAVEAILAHHNGYAATLTVSAEGDTGRDLHASLKVPAGELPAALTELKRLGKIGEESQSGEDVSQQQQDLAARLKTARTTEERFRAILAQRPGTVSDVMDVEENIERVRGDIEQMEAEEKDLHHRVDYATVDLTMTQIPVQSGSGTSAMRQIRKALSDGWHLGGDVVLGILLFVAQYGLATLIWMGLLGVPGWFVWRRYRRLSSRD